MISNLRAVRAVHMYRSLPQGLCRRAPMWRILTHRRPGFVLFWCALLPAQPL